MSSQSQRELFFWVADLIEGFSFNNRFQTVAETMMDHPNGKSHYRRSSLAPGVVLAASPRPGLAAPLQLLDAASSRTTFPACARSGGFCASAPRTSKSHHRCHRSTPACPALTNALLRHDESFAVTSIDNSPCSSRSAQEPGLTA
ncbi:hypothetical protein L596_021743 [Steinernema carpocapsae]|uniref:Uncharacterized protein n=1 Tax=Steinernema carpocapsae TaxID=34508 RepID=A0A4U5MKG6_STECR|nr:hypothetical protein L596_021743 [Steinernema carpocapsae]